MGEKALRGGKDLLLATKPFARDSRGRSWWLFGTTLLALLAVLATAVLAPWWPARLAAALVGALLMVRSFMFFHDLEHGAIFHGDRLARPIVELVGLVMLVPPRSWRDSHNYHHAHVAQLDGPAIGSFPVKSVEAWGRATTWERLQYRVSRHPLTILFAGLTVFALNITLLPLLRDPRRHWDSALALALHGGVVTGLWLLGGPSAALLGFVLPYSLAAAMGAYLFYAQHNFPGVRMLRAEEWTYYRAALESSSYLKMGRVLRWFTGDIGFHHVHHLNPAIPLYRLAETMAALPELQSPKSTSLRVRDIAAGLRAHIWDEAAQKMVSYRVASAEAHRAAPRAARGSTVDSRPTAGTAQGQGASSAGNAGASFSSAVSALQRPPPEWPS